MAFVGNKVAPNLSMQHFVYQVRSDINEVRKFPISMAEAYNADVALSKTNISSAINTSPHYHPDLTINHNGRVYPKSTDKVKLVVENPRSLPTTILGSNIGKQFGNKAIFEKTKTIISKETKLEEARLIPNIAVNLQASKVDSKKASFAQREHSDINSGNQISR